MDVVFTVYYDGNFVSNEVGEEAYKGGSVVVINSPAERLYENLMSKLSISMYDKSIWYKFPFEEVNEKRKLGASGNTFKKMCDTTIWLKFIDIFVEGGTESIDVELSDEGRWRHEEEYENVDERRVNEEIENVEVNEHEEEEAHENAAEEEEACVEDEENAEVCDEEARVEYIVSQIVDEDDENDEDYRATPTQSDDEDERYDKYYERWRRGSGELKIAMLFESIPEFKEAVIEYALKGGWNIRFTRSGSLKGSAVCGVKNAEFQCPWRIYCSYDETVGKWLVKTYQEKHICFTDGECMVLTETVIAKLVASDFRNDENMTSKTIQQLIQERYDLNPSRDKCRKALTKVKRVIEEEYREQYQRIKDYEIEIKE